MAEPVDVAGDEARVSIEEVEEREVKGEDEGECDVGEEEGEVRLVVR